LKALVEKTALLISFNDLQGDLEIFGAWSTCLKIPPTELASLLFAQGIDMGIGRLP